MNHATTHRTAGHRLRRTLLGLTLLLLAAWSAAQVSGYELPGDAVYPEGIAYDEAADTLWVTSTTDGAILQIDGASGEVTTFSEGGADGRATALGMDYADGRLWVAGSAAGTVYVYDTESGELVQQYQAESERPLFNDVIATPTAAYVTDSFSPTLYRVEIMGDEVSDTLEPWLDFTGTALEYGEGVNLNGIEATDDGQHLIAVHMGRGELYRIDVESREVAQIDLGGDTLMRGDGLVLDGQTLYVIYNGNPDGVRVSTVELSDDLASGTVTANYTAEDVLPSLATGVIRDGELLVVATQFPARNEGNPELPFTDARIPLSMLSGE